MSKIDSLQVKEIIDGSGYVAIEAVIKVDQQTFCASVPVIFNGETISYLKNFGFNLNLESNKFLEIIKKEILKIATLDQKKIDDILEKRLLLADEEFGCLKAVSLAISLACAKALAKVNQQPLFVFLNNYYSLPEIKNLPTPIINLFNGGQSGDTNLDFEEFLLIPTGQKKFEAKIALGLKVFHQMAVILKRSGYDTDLGGYGGYAPDIISSIGLIEMVIAAIIEAGYQPRQEANLGINLGAGNLYNSATKQYVFRLDQSYFNSTTLVDLYYTWLEKYPIVYLEDCLAGSDIIGWAKATKDLADKIILTGSNFYNDQQDLKINLANHLANTIIIDLSKAITLTQLFDLIKLVQKYNYRVVISAQKRETSDTCLADIAVASGADFVKFGSFSRAERVDKYNRLLEIANLLA